MQVPYNHKLLTDDINQYVATKGDTYADFARKCNISKAAVSRILKGDYPMGELVLHKISKILGQSSDKYLA